MAHSKPKKTAPRRKKYIAGLPGPAPKETARRLSAQFRRLAVNQPKDWGGASAGYAYLRTAKLLESAFGLQSPPDPHISDGIDN